MALFGRRWRTAQGAESTTYFGRIRAARGRGRVSFVQIVPPHYGALRGDLVAGLRDRFPLRDPPVDALLAALLGGAARGTITLRCVREIAWSRHGKHRRLESSQLGFDDISVEPLGGLDVGEDALLFSLIFPPDHAIDTSSTGYRGELVRAPSTVLGERPLGIVELLARAVPTDDLAESWIARRAATAAPAPLEARVSSLLEEAWRDEPNRELFEELVRHLRFALRSALAARGDQR